MLILLTGEALRYRVLNGSVVVLVLVKNLLFYLSLLLFIVIYLLYIHIVYRSNEFILQGHHMDGSEWNINSN